LLILLVEIKKEVLMKKDVNKREKMVLVVDDETSVCKSVKRILEKDGLEIDEALSGEEALNLLTKKQYGVVVTDMMMPGIGGMDLIRAVNQKWPEISVIMITGYATIKTAVQAMKTGAFDYIPKPFTPEELSGVVSRAMERMKIYLKEKSGEIEEPRRRFKKGEQRYYILEHSWAFIEDDGNVRVGVDDMFLRTTGDIINFDLPFEGDMLEQGMSCARITCHGLKINKVWSPVSGKVIQVNEKLNKDPSSVYADGWLMVVKPTDLEEDLKNLVLIE
jgi:FixJ family two-component response regulator/glycine cleavage system H lipoate-binding protein